MEVVHPLDVHDPQIPIICKFCFGHENLEKRRFCLEPEQLDCLKCNEPFGCYHWAISSCTLICRSCASKRGICQCCQCKRKKIDIVNAWSAPPADEKIGPGIDNGLTRPTEYADIIVQKKKESWFTATTTRETRQGSRARADAAFEKFTATTSRETRQGSRARAVAWKGSSAQGPL